MNKKHVFSLCAVLALLISQIASAGTNVIASFATLTDPEVDGQPSATVVTNFIFDEELFTLQVFAEAGTNTTFDPADPNFVIGSALRLVNFGLAVEMNDPNRFDRNDAMRFTVTIFDDRDRDVTDNFSIFLNKIIINDRSDGMTNVIIYTLGQSVSYVPSAVNDFGRELEFGPAAIMEPFVMTTDNKDPAGGLGLDALLQIRALGFDVIPEPGSFVLLGLFGFLAMLRRR